jgi:hypothetical protein
MIIMSVNDKRDYSKNYGGKKQDVKTTCLILTKADGTEVKICADDLEALLALISS